MLLPESIQDIHKNITFDPIKVGTPRAALPERKCVDFTMLHIYSKFERFHQEMLLPERIQDIHINMTFDPIKDGTLRAASPKRINLYI